jgi:hypothetical protein
LLDVLVCIRVFMKKDLMYIFIGWSHVLIAYIELESTWIHDYPGASNGMSMSKKVDCSCSSGKTC